MQVSQVVQHTEMDGGGIVSDELRAALEQLKAAIREQGPAPAYHRAVMARQRAEWPTFWNAIDQVFRAMRRGT